MLVQSRRALGRVGHSSVRRGATTRQTTNHRKSAPLSVPALYKPTARVAHAQGHGGRRSWPQELTWASNPGSDEHRRGGRSSASTLSSPSRRPESESHHLFKRSADFCHRVTQAYSRDRAGHRIGHGSAVPGRSDCRHGGLSFASTYTCPVCTNEKVNAAICSSAVRTCGTESWMPSITSKLPVNATTAPLSANNAQNQRQENVCRRRSRY